MKWFVPEIHADAAQRLQVPAHQLHVPTLFDAEVANIVWKKLRNGDLNQAEADAIIAGLPPLPVTRHPEAPLLSATFELAVKTQRTVYDSLYLALAIQLGGQVVTADQKWWNSLQGTAWAGYLVRVETIA